MKNFVAVLTVLGILSVSLTAHAACGSNSSRNSTTRAPSSSSTTTGGNGSGTTTGAAPAGQPR